MKNPASDARREGVPGGREDFPEEDSLLPGEDSASGGICRAAIPVTFPVSRQLREEEVSELSSGQGAGCPGTWLFLGLSSRNDPVGGSHLDLVSRCWAE